VQDTKIFVAMPMLENGKNIDRIYVKSIETNKPAFRGYSRGEDSKPTFPSLYQRPSNWTALVHESFVWM
jgi:hypothetical protein